MTRYVNPQHITDIEYYSFTSSETENVGMFIYLIGGRHLEVIFKTSKERDELLSKIRNNVSHLVEI